MLLRQLISWVAGDVHSIIFPVSGAGLQLALSHGPPNGEAQLTIHHRRSLLEHLRGQLAVDWWGHHGIAHWARVRANGLMLARDTGANLHVVELFAFFHDARRINEYDDEDHGARGGELAKRLRGRYFDATDDEMDLLAYACTHHSDGMNIISMVSELLHQKEPDSPARPPAIGSYCADLALRWRNEPRAMGRPDRFDRASPTGVPAHSKR